MKTESKPKVVVKTKGRLCQPLSSMSGIQMPLHLVPIPQDTRHKNFTKNNLSTTTSAILPSKDDHEK